MIKKTKNGLEVNLSNGGVFVSSIDYTETPTFTGIAFKNAEKHRIGEKSEENDKKMPLSELKPELIINVSNKESALVLVDAAIRAYYYLFDRENNC